MGRGSSNGLVGRAKGGGKHEVRLPSIFEQGLSSPGRNLRRQEYTKLYIHVVCDHKGKGLRSLDSPAPTSLVQRPCGTGMSLVLYLLVRPSGKDETRGTSLGILDEREERREGGRR